MKAPTASLRAPTRTTSTEPKAPRVDRFDIPALQIAVLITLIFIVYWHGLWAGAPRADQVAYLHQVSQYTSFTDIVKLAPAWHRTHGTGDTVLFRPVLFLLLGLEYYFFGYHFFWWQLLALMLHCAQCIALYVFLRRTALVNTFLPLLLAMGFGVSYLGSEQVLWNHLTGYILFTFLTTLSLLWFLKCLDNNGSRAFFWALVLAFVATFTYEMGAAYDLLIALVCGGRTLGIATGEKRHDLRPWLFRAFLMAALPVCYVVVSWLNYRSIFSTPFLSWGSSPAAHAPPALLSTVAIELRFWLAALVGPVKYNLMPGARVVFSGYGTALSFPIIFNFLSALSIAAGAVLMMIVRRRALTNLRIVPAVIVAGFLTGYALLIAVGRSAPRGLDATLAINVYYAYISQLTFLLALGMLFLRSASDKPNRCPPPGASGVVGSKWSAGACLCIGAGVLGLTACQAARTYSLVYHLRYDYASHLQRVIDAVETWNVKTVGLPNVFFAVGADCRNDYLDWFSHSYFRRNSIWHGPVTFADALFPDRSYVLNQGWLRDASAQVTEIHCGEPVESGSANSSGILIHPDRISTSKPAGLHSGEHAFDGSLSQDDFWEVGGPLPVWIDAALESPAKVVQYELLCGQSGDRMPRSWKVFGATDAGASWTELDSRTELRPWVPFTRRRYEIPRPSSYRVYRLEILSTADPQDILRIYEIRLYGPAEMEREPPPSGTLVTPKSVRASRQSGSHPVNRAFDGSTAPDNFWEAPGPYPVSLDVELPGATAIRRYEFLSGEFGDRMPRVWRLLGSSDGGKSWIQLDTRTENRPWGPFTRRTYDITRPAPFTLYRVEFSSAFDPNILRIYEVRFDR